MLVVSPNITVDRVVLIEELIPGAVLRSSAPAVSAGGKGVNVGRTVCDLGGQATLVGFFAQDDKKLLDGLFELEPIDLIPVPLAGRARVATIYKEVSGRVTVVNEPGPTVAPDDWARLEHLVMTELESGKHQTLICSGSLPPGSPDDGYGRLALLGKRAACCIIVDSAKSTLLAALAARPDFVTPNLSEAEAVLGHSKIEVVVEDRDPGLATRARAAALALCKAGAVRAVVTAGAAGAAASNGVVTSWIAAPNVEVVNPIGAGDSLVGGLAYGLETLPDEDRAVFAGVATASASVEQPIAGHLDGARARYLDEMLHWGRASGDAGVARG